MITSSKKRRLKWSHEGYTIQQWIQRHQMYLRSKPVIKALQNELKQVIINYKQQQKYQDITQFLRKEDKDFDIKINNDIKQVINSENEKIKANRKIIDSLCQNKIRNAIRLNHDKRVNSDRWHNVNYNPRIEQSLSRTPRNEIPSPSDKKKQSIIYGVNMPYIEKIRNRKKQTSAHSVAVLAINNADTSNVSLECSFKQLAPSLIGKECNEFVPCILEQEAARTDKERPPYQDFVRLVELDKVKEWEGARHPSGEIVVLYIRNGKHEDEQYYDYVMISKTKLLECRARKPCGLNYKLILISPGTVNGYIKITGVAFLNGYIKVSRKELVHPFWKAKHLIRTQEDLDFFIWNRKPHPILWNMCDATEFERAIYVKYRQSTGRGGLYSFTDTAKLTFNLPIRRTPYICSFKERHQRQNIYIPDGIQFWDPVKCNVQNLLSEIRSYYHENAQHNTGDNDTSSNESPDLLQPIGLHPYNVKCIKLIFKQTNADDAENSQYPRNQNCLIDLIYLTTHQRKIDDFTITSLCNALTNRPNWYLITQTIESWLLIPKGKSKKLKYILSKLIRNDLGYIKWLNYVDALIISTFKSYEGSGLDAVTKTRYCKNASTNDKFGRTALDIAVSCQYCHDPNNDGYITQLVPMAPYLCRGICFNCAKLPPFLRDDINFSIDYTRIRLFNEDAEDKYSYFVGVPSVYKHQIFIDEWFCPQRTYRLPTSVAKKVIDNYAEQERQIHLRPKNVVYKASKHKLDLTRGVELIRRGYPHITEYLFSNGNRYGPFTFNKKKHVVHFGEHGSIQQNHYVAYEDGMFATVGGYQSLDQEYIKTLKVLFGVDKHPLEVNLFQQICGAGFWATTGLYVSLRGMSQTFSYKSGKPCALALSSENREIQQNYLKHRDITGLPHLEEYVEKDVLKKVVNNYEQMKQAKKRNELLLFKQLDNQRISLAKNLRETSTSKYHQLIRNNMVQWLNINYPKLMNMQNELRLLVSVTLAATAANHPATAPTFVKHFEKGIGDGRQLTNVDTMIYSGHEILKENRYNWKKHQKIDCNKMKNKKKFNGHSVASHNDLDGLICDSCLNFIFVIKHRGDCLVCHNCTPGGGGANCVNPIVTESSPKYGGHHDIGSKTGYAMFNRGAARGPEHALHGYLRNKNGKYLGFDSDQYTDVLRPVNEDSDDDE